MRKVRLTEMAVEEGGDNRLLNLPNRQIVVTKDGVEVGIDDADILLSGYPGLVEEIEMPAETPVEGPAAEETSVTETDTPETERLGGSSGALQAPEDA